ncbi:MAG: hypothetical protein ACRBDL_00455 [Alphaproteobacteria bacterium]
MSSGPLALLGDVAVIAKADDINILENSRYSRNDFYALGWWYSSMAHKGNHQRRIWWVTEKVHTTVEQFIQKKTKQ